MNSQHDQPAMDTPQQALIATVDKLFHYLLAPQTDILLAALKNRNLTEEHLLALLKRRDLPEEVLQKIYRRQTESLSHRLLVALLKNPHCPTNIVRNLAPQLRLFELADLSLLPGISSDQRLVFERIILHRLPTIPLGNKMTLARRATTTIVAAILKEGDTQLINICLSSPRLQEAAIYQFINSPKATAETISIIARHQRWQQRPNLRLAILKNRKTPEIWFTLWLPKLQTPLLKQLLASRRHTASQKKLLETALKNR